MNKIIKTIRSIFGALGVIGAAVAVVALGLSKGKEKAGDAQRKKIMADFGNMSDAAKWELAHGLDGRIGNGKHGAGQDAD
jgi:hypothetical protein